MTKAEKKMGIERLKYDSKKQAPKSRKKASKKPYAVIIPERPMTDHEARQMENDRFWIIRSWEKHNFGKYRTEYDANQSLNDALRKFDMSTYNLRYYEIYRAQIVDLRTGEILRDVSEERCPVCHSPNIVNDPDFPDTMKDCKTCGSEWNEMEVTFNSREDC